MKTNETTTTTTVAPFKFNKKGGQAPLSAFRLNEANRLGIGINPTHAEGLSISIRKEGWLPSSVLEVTEDGVIVSGNHRFLGAEMAGYEGLIPYVVIPSKMNETDRLVRSYSANISLGNSPLETSLLVGELSRSGMKNKAIAARLFPSKKGAESLVSQHLAFIRSCPPWLVSAIEDGKISYSQASKLIGTFGDKIESERAEIEARTPENPWVKIKTLLTPAPTTPTEPKASELPAPSQPEAKGETTPSVPTTPTTTQEAPASVVMVSPTDTSVTSAKPDPELAMPTTPAPVIITLESIAELPLTEGVDRLLRLTDPDDAQKLDALLEKKYGREALDAEVDQQDGELSKVDIAPTTTPTTQNNPNTDRRKGSVSIKSGPQRIKFIAAGLAKMVGGMPTELGALAGWVDSNCFVGADGQAYLRIVPEGSLRPYLLALGTDMVG